MEPPFCERTRRILLDTAAKIGMPCHKTGTVVVIQGPRYSSKAESVMYQQWGGHFVGMTSVPEVKKFNSLNVLMIISVQLVLAKEAGICYALIAMATDYDCWRTTGEKVSASFVLETFKKNVNKVTNLITNVIPAIANENWDDTIKELHVFMFLLFSHVCFLNQLSLQETIKCNTLL